jgi:phosphoglycerate dehydrogenase-like enzyme
VPPEACKIIERGGFKLRHEPAEDLDRDQLHRALAGVSGYLIGGNEKPLDEHFAQAEELEVVAWVGTDFRANVPGWKRAFDLGIAFVSTPGENAASVAEFTLLLILGIARPFIPRAGTEESGNSAGTETRDSFPPGVELHGQTLGIVGAGRIGSRVARAALGLGMQVLYAAPRRNEALEAALGIEYFKLAQLLKESEVVSLHRPGLADGEQPTLGHAELERLGAGALLVNTAHPSLIDPDALLRAIEQRGLRAAVDGIGKEPAWTQLVALGPDRFLCAPDMGYRTPAAGLRAGKRAAQAVCDVLSGKDSASVNNPDFQERRAW